MTHGYTNDATQEYVHELIEELRDRDVPGTRIGEVVAEVESHVADSGEQPVEAFGPPRQYATDIAAAHPPEPSAHWSLTRFWALAYASVIGGLLVANGVGAAARGGPARLTTGTLVVLVFFPPMAVLLAGGIVRGLRRRPLPWWRWALWGAVYTLPAVAVPALLDEVLLTYPPWLEVAAGVAMLTPWLWVRPDPVVDPRWPRSRRPSRPAWALVVALVLATPLTLVVLADVLLP